MGAADGHKAVVTSQAGPAGKQAKLCRISLVGSG